MGDFEGELNDTVQSFVTHIAELARQAAIGTVESAFGAGTNRAGGA